jgi:TM2 domain-containing membrane protein YozV
LYHTPKKSRSISVGLALVLGGIGAHKFYLGKPGKGLLYMLFCWSGIPTLVGLYEAVKYIWMDEADFHQRYARGDL